MSKKKTTYLTVGLPDRERARKAIDEYLVLKGTTTDAPISAGRDILRLLEKENRNLRKRRGAKA